MSVARCVSSVRRNVSHFLTSSCAVETAHVQPHVSGERRARQHVIALFDEPHQADAQQHHALQQREEHAWPKACVLRGAHCLPGIDAINSANTRAFAYIEEPRGCENVPRVFLTVAVVLGLAPFVSSLVARLGKRVFAARFVPDPEARGREAASGKPAIMTIDRVADTAGPREDGSLELSASAFCFQGPEPLSVVIRQSLSGVSLRVTFDGRVLRSSNDPIIDSHTGETHTLLRVFPPDSWNGDTPVGRAWVVTGYQEKGSAGSSPGDREGTETRDDAGTDPCRPVGAAAPLLFLPDAETALEVNAMVALVRKKMDGVNADKLLLRLGNCITRATNNARDMVAMIDAVTAMGMKRCEAMLRGLATEQTSFRAGDVSQAPACKGAKREGHTSRDIRRRRRRSHKLSSASEDNDDVVEGPAADARFFDEPVGTRTRSRR